MRQTVATLKNQINQEIEKGNYDAVDALTQELCRLQGLDQVECEMPESFMFELRQKGKTEKMINMRKNLAKVAAVVAILGISGGTAVAATQHFQQAKHFDNGLVAGDAEITDTAGTTDTAEMTISDESMFTEQPVLPEGDTDSEIEILSSEEGTSDTAWLKKVVSRVTDERYASDDGVNWKLDEPDVKEVTEYTYPDYGTACEDMGIVNFLQKSFEQDGTAAYRITHVLDDDITDVSELTAGFIYGNGRFTIEQFYDQEKPDQFVLITSTEGTTNQREYVSEKGETFVLSDDTETGETRTTTMVTYGNYNVILTFTGMSDNEIHEVLDAVSQTK